MGPFESSRNPVFFIAEIGGNHEGNLDAAIRMTDLAIESGADAVKFQIYEGDTLVSRVEGADRNKHFKKFELGREAYELLADRCEKANVQFMASVWSLEQLEWAEPRVQIHKIGSGDVTAFPMIKAMALSGKPIILSTGLCNLQEIQRAVDYIVGIDERYRSHSKLSLLQCTSSYPCPDEDANIAVMQTLKDEFGLPVGYSDHTLGNDAAFASAVLGAEIIEMHFTDSRDGKEFRDHKVSITRDETIDLLDRIRRVKVQIGSKEKGPTESEIASGHISSFRRSVYVSRDVIEGEVFDEGNLTVLRPEHGVPAYQYFEIVGRKAKRSMQQHEVIQMDDLA